MTDTTREWQLTQPPTEGVKLAGPNATFKLVETRLPPRSDTDLLVQPLYFSNDPAQRRWIMPVGDPTRAYISPVAKDDPMRSLILARVLESSVAEFPVNALVLGTGTWSEKLLVKAKDMRLVPELPDGLSNTHFLGAFGAAGLTAYLGLTEIGNVKSGDVVVVSGAAGATGSMAVQIAKKMLGAGKVVGLAGTEAKCRWVERLGADVCLNYRSESFAKELMAALPGPNGFANVYFDNVGGEITDLMLARMAKEGRVVACGSISHYDKAADEVKGFKNWFEIIAMRLTIRGIIIYDWREKYPAVTEELIQAVREGKIVLDESEHVVQARFEDVPKTWMQLFEGGNTGKLLTQLIS